MIVNGLDLKSNKWRYSATDPLGPCVCVEQGLSTWVGKAWMNDK
ncbi:mCG1041629 [Mus musculus]|nr:mCG1041629 [Mus musculus]